MRNYRLQSFQDIEPPLRNDGPRASLSGLDANAARTIQRGAINTQWRGVSCAKSPFDLALYSQLLWELRPATIIELGDKSGGSALWFADQAHAMGLNSRVLRVDPTPDPAPADRRITVVSGDIHRLATLLPAEVLAGLPHPWLVVDSSQIDAATTLKVLAFFAPVMIGGDYLVVEGGMADTLQDEQHPDETPNQAIDAFLADHPASFEVDGEYCDFFGYNVTWCANGWLRRSSLAWGQVEDDTKERIQEILADAKAAFNAKDYETVRRLLQPVVQENEAIVALFYMARAVFAGGDSVGAQSHLDRFKAFSPDHKGAHLLQAEIHLKEGDIDSAAAAVDAALRIDPQLKPAQKIAESIALKRRESDVRKSIDILDNGYLRARTEGPTAAMREAAAHLAAAEKMSQWANNVDAAKLAYFRNATDLDAALRNYDAHLIRVSVDYAYITWPQRIQEFVKGKSVADIGCGFGGYGMGFLVAGARSYVGLDPVMALDSTRAKNKRTRAWADMGVTPRDIMHALPAIELLQGTAEDIELGTTYDTVALHNVTEHLIQIEQVFAGLVKLCHADTKLVFLHHNYYCWNGHHLQPNRPDQLDPSNPKHLAVSDWHHIDQMNNVPDDHYTRTHLNRIRLDELKALTARYFQIDTWLEQPSSPATLARFTPEILERVKGTIPDLTQRELETNVVYCVASRKPA